MRKLTGLMDLTGRSALVTGGAGHIGLAACEALMELGANVAILDFDTNACQQRAEQVSNLGPGIVLPVPCDLKDDRATRSAVNRVVREAGRLDILIHCAAYVGATQVPGWAVPFKDQTVEAWDAALRVNLTSAFIMVQEAREALAESGAGICNPIWFHIRNSRARH